MVFLHFLAGFRTDILNQFFLYVTALAQELVVIGIVCWLYWCKNKRLGRTLGFSFFASSLFVQGLKITFRIPRPWILEPDFEPVAEAVPQATGFSFPSGHTQSITSLFGTLGFYFKKRSLRIASYLLIFLVGFSRMYLGVHTPKDVLAAFFLSLVISAFCYHFTYERLFFPKKELTVSSKGRSVFSGSPFLTAFLLILLSLLIAAYGIVLYQKELLDLDYARDCLKVSGAGLAFGFGYYMEETLLKFEIPTEISRKLLRFAAGLLTTILLLKGLKPLIGESLIASFVRYFIAVLWVVFLYPLVFTRFHRTPSA